MNVPEILAELREQLIRVDSAISALERVHGTSHRGPGRPKGKRRTMSAEARAKIGLRSEHVGRSRRGQRRKARVRVSTLSEG